MNSYALTDLDNCKQGDGTVSYSQTVDHIDVAMTYD